MTSCLLCVCFTGGLLNDWIGRKPVITLASLVFMAGSLLLALAENRSMLLVGRFIVGAGIGQYAHAHTRC